MIPFARINIKFYFELIEVTNSAYWREMKNKS